MRFFCSNETNLEALTDVIRPIDNSVIHQLALLAFKVKKDDDASDIRSILYDSKYQPSGLENKERNLNEYLQQLNINNGNIRTEVQPREYQWVKINTNKMGPISHRFYLAPNPEKMHEIVRKITDAFIHFNIPVRFKYQLTTGMECLDRIIIYSDNEHRKDIINALQLVYEQNPQLFTGCERSLAWIYGTKVPCVYQAPETPGMAYSNAFSDVLIEAKGTICYLYGVTTKNRRVDLDEVGKEQALKYMETIISSIMFRKGLLLSKDYRRITIRDKNVKAYYNYDTGILEHFNDSEKGFDNVIFLPTYNGRCALLDHFYSVSQITPQKDIIVRHLTREERQEEVMRALYPSLFQEGNQSSKH